MFITFVSVLCFLRCSDNDAGDGTKLCYLCYTRVAASHWKIHRQGCLLENKEILGKMEVNKDAKCGSCGQGLRLWPASRASPFTCGNQDCSHADKPVMTNVRYNCFPCDFDLCGKCASSPPELVKLANQGRELLSPLVLAAEPIIMDNQSKPYPEPQVGVLVDLDSVDGETLIMDTRQATVAYPAQRNSPPNYSGVDSFQTPISPLAARNPRRGGSLRERSVPSQMTSTRQSFSDRRHQGMDEPMVPFGCDTPTYDSSAVLSPYGSPPRRLSNFDPIPRHSGPMSPRHSNSPSRQSPMSSPRQGGNFDGSANQSPLRGQNMRRHSPPMSLYHGEVLPRHTPPLSPRGSRRTPPMSPPRGDLSRRTPPMSPPRGDMLQGHGSPMSPRRSMNVEITERQSSRPMNPGTGDRWSQQDQRLYGAATISVGNLDEPGQIEADSSYPGMHCRRNPLYFNY